MPWGWGAGYGEDTAGVWACSFRAVHKRKVLAMLSLITKVVSTVKTPGLIGPYGHAQLVC